MANGGIIGPVVTPPNIQTQSAPGVWTLQEAQEYIRQGLWPRRYDPLYNYTTLLLSGNGANNATNNSFLDSSSNNFTVTRNGNTTQGTFSPFSQTGWGNYFDGTGDYLSVADNSVLRLGTSNFTIECWVNRAANGTAHSILAKGGATTGWLLEVTSGNLLQFTHTTTTITTSLPVYAGNWVHVAAVREGTGSNQFKLYINGTLAQTATMATDFTQTDTLYIGANRSAATTMNGYISNVRIVNGTALYTAQFTPSTTPLTTTSQGATAAQVELLTCQSNRFLDNSGNGFTVTPAGNSAVVAFSPFNATRPWDPLTYGGGGYFDGSGDYLTATNNSAYDFGSGDFTIEAFAYPTTASQLAFCARGETTGFSGFILSTTNFLATTNGSSWDISISFTTALTANAWNHVALVRNGNVYTAYLNGVANGTTTVSGTIVAGTAALTIGRRSGQTDYSGYLSSLRLVKGTAVYTSAFTPPTSPLTNITNTSLLLNFTNIGITDATSKNALETVGDAKISTAQSKFGGSSIAFDGTGDYLLSNAASTDLYAFGSGDWTIECWVYFNNLTGDGIIYDGKLADGAYPTIYRSTSTIIYYTNGANRITSGTISATTWYHVAVSRSGTSVKLFINGVQAGSTYTDSQTYLCPANRPVIGAAGSSGFVGAASLNGYLQDLRVTKGVARYTANFAVPDSAFPTLGSTPPSVDPYFDYTTLLLPGSGSNNATNNSFLDSSANNFTITRNGNTTQGTFSPFSQTGWGNYFDGTGDKLTVAANTAFQFGTGDFCIEFWIYPVSLSNYQTPIDMGYSGSGSYVIQTGNGNGIPTFITGGSVLITSSTAWTANSFNHVVVCRSGTTLSMFLNGLRTGTASNSTNFNSNSTLGIGAAATASPDYPINGYMSNVRLVKGTAVYDPTQTSITVPTAPLTPITNTSLLTCQSNRFRDASTNNFTITPAGNTSVVAFSPFNPSASWSAATYGGSGYFDGSGDYLATPSNAAFGFGTGDYTIEGWVFPIPSGKIMRLLEFSAGGDNLELNSNGTAYTLGGLSYYNGSAVVANGSAGLIQYAWNHIVLQRTSGTVRIYVNALSVLSTGTTPNTSARTLYIGGLNSDATFSLFSGYLASFRIVKGSAVYSGTSTTVPNFTLPTAPLTAITNTSLLLNFTNTGIYDATSKNVLETVGDAKISTAQSVWTAYGASMYFDGTGDYLLSQASNDLYAFGSGDFTIELWLRLNNVSGQKNIYDPNPTSTVGLYPNIYILNTTLYYFTNGSNRIIAGTALSADTWYHIAVARSGTSTKMFLNGTQEGSTYTDSNVYINGGAGRPVIGGSGYTLGSNILNGYIQDLRITKGYARYTANFQPPSAPLALR